MWLPRGCVVRHNRPVAGRLEGARAGDGAPLVKPDAFIEYLAAHAGVSVQGLRVASVVVAVWSRPLYDGLVARLAAEQVPAWWSGSHAVGMVAGQAVSLVLLPVGAPGTVMAMEELIAAGAGAFIGCGIAGGLQPDCGPGAAVVATAAIRDEGTSRHYADESVDAIADKGLSETLLAALADAGMQPRAGCVWTTDAPYRELAGTVARLRSAGVLAVDAETSAMYVLGVHRNVPVANVLLISDVLSDPWQPAFGSPGLAAALDAMPTVIERAVTSALPPQE